MVPVHALPSSLAVLTFLLSVASVIAEPYRPAVRTAVSSSSLNKTSKTSKTSTSPTSTNRHESTITATPTWIYGNDPLSCYPAAVIKSTPPWWGNQSIPDNTCTHKQTDGCNAWTPCSVTVGEVRVVYWHTVEKGFTALTTTSFDSVHDHIYTYPSVYLIFHTMHAWNDCPNPRAQVGPTMTSAIHGFDLTEISTLVPYTAAAQTGYTYAELSISDLTSNCPSTLNTHSAYTETHPYATNRAYRCAPRISIPAKVAMSYGYPWWHGCTVLNTDLGLVDPPSALIPAVGLMTTTPVAETTESVVVAPVPAITSTAPAAVDPKPTTTSYSVIPNDPSPAADPSPLADPAPATTDPVSDPAQGDTPAIVSANTNTNTNAKAVTASAAPVAPQPATAITVTSPGTSVVYMDVSLTIGGGLVTITSLAAVMSYGPGAIIAQYPSGAVSTIPVQTTAANDSPVIASAIIGILNGTPDPVATSSVSSTASTSTLAGPTTLSISSPSTSSAAAPSSSASNVCISGTGDGNFAGLCSFSCNYGYCPPGPCTCTAYGKQVTAPAETEEDGVPLPGESVGYIGLCSFACSHGYCPGSACTTTTGNGTTLTSSSASPTGTVCIAGTGDGNFAGLCSFCCNYGYCPSEVCTCSKYGVLVPTPPTSSPSGVPLPGESDSYLGLCSFACNHGYCPDSACMTSNGTLSYSTTISVFSTTKPTTSSIGGSGTSTSSSPTSTPGIDIIVSAAPPARTALVLWGFVLLGFIVGLAVM